MDYICVTCANPDVKKVSAIVREETWETKTHGQSYGYRRDRDGRWRPDPRSYTETKSGKSELAKLLAAPEEPIFILLSPHWYYLLAILAAWFLTPSFSGFVLVWFILTGIYGQVKKPLYRSYKRYKERAAKEREKWEQAMKTWNTLYYCSRCDSVYNPETGQSAPVNEMRTLL